MVTPEVQTKILQYLRNTISRRANLTAIRQQVGLNRNQLSQADVLSIPNIHAIKSNGMTWLTLREAATNAAKQRARWNT